MLKVLIVYAHLLATCLALGLVLATDLRLAARLWARATSRPQRERAEPLRLTPPSGFVVRAVAASLVVLLATGVALVALALHERPDALANPKLQAKIACVGALLVNAWVLHRITFPRLARAEGWRMRRAADRLEIAWRVAAPAAVSQGLWIYCAFLGVARPWNYTISLAEALAWGGGVIVTLWVGMTALLVTAATPVPTPLYFVPKMRSPASPSPGTM